MSTTTNMVHFVKLTKSQFDSAKQYYTGGKATMEHERFWTFLANAFQRYIHTGRVDTLNLTVQAALSCGRYRPFVRVTKSLCAHEWDDAKRQFVGKADKKKLTRLRKQTAEGGEAWEELLFKNLEKEMQHSETKPVKAWDEDAAILNFVKGLAKHGVSADSKAVLQKIEKAAKEVQVKAA